ncbi:MAG: gamma-glutamylcyclotransferase [Saccharospirillum sp.]|nr:gamma-glutamylcyclotransferase [Saccharospirillum sp.]
METPDAFAHHPELRSRITDPETSFYRTFNVDAALALDRDKAGDGCEGLAFRIPAHAVDAETEILWRREVIAPGYVPSFIQTDLADGPVQALTFIADHAVPDVRSDIDPVDQVRFIATGAGFLGTSREYLASIVDHFTHLGIADHHCSDLLREVDDYIASQPKRRMD